MFLNAELQSQTKLSISITISAWVILGQKKTTKIIFWDLFVHMYDQCEFLLNYKFPNKFIS